MSVKPSTSDRTAAVALKTDERLPLFVISKEGSVFDRNWICHFRYRSFKDLDREIEQVHRETRLFGRGNFFTTRYVV